MSTILVTAKLDHITATSCHLSDNRVAIEEEPWIPKEKLRRMFHHRQ